MQLGTGSRAEAETEKEPQKPLTIQHKASNSCVLLRIDRIVIGGAQSEFQLTIPVNS